MKWLLLRGLGREQRHWHDFPARLARDLNASEVSTLDLAGAGTEHGRSSYVSIARLAEDVVARTLRKAPAGERLGLMGLSLGGMVALELAARGRPEIAACVVINSSSRASATFARMRPRAAGTIVGLLARGDALAREERVLALTSRLPGGVRSERARAAAHFALQRPMSRKSFACQLVAAARFRPPPVEQMGTPLLFLSSRGDALVDPRCSADLARRYAAPHVQHPWAGHDLPLDDPDWVLTQIADWWSKLHARCSPPGAAPAGVQVATP
jgi:pimeloyl-ACP methyl ester carboxylesterase